MQTKHIPYQDNNANCKAYMVFDETKSKPQKTVIIAPAFNGISDFIKDYANKVAKAGYVAFVIDLAGDGKHMENIDDCIEHAMHFIHHRDALQSRVLAGFHTACAQPEIDETKIAAMGFCLGGMSVLDLARTGVNLKGAVSLHGVLAPPPQTLQTKPIQAKVLILHGYEDHSVPPESIKPFAEEMNIQQVDWQFMFFGNTKHAYTEPGAENFGPPEFGRKYNADSARRAWVYAQAFFAEVLA